MIKVDRKPPTKMILGDGFFICGLSHKAYFASRTFYRTFILNLKPGNMMSDETHNLLNEQGYLTVTKMKVKRDAEGKK